MINSHWEKYWQVSQNWVLIHSKVLSGLLPKRVCYEDNDCSEFVVHSFYYVGVGSFYADFLESFFFFLSNTCLILSKSLSVSIEMVIWFLSFNSLIWCITLIDLHLLKNPYILGVKPSWSCCYDLCCWILFARTLLRIFVSVFISDGGGGGLVAKSWPTLVTPWTVAHQAPLSMGFSRQEYWSGLPFPSPLACNFHFLCVIFLSGFCIRVMGLVSG